MGKYRVFDGASASAMFVNGGAGAGYIRNDGQCAVRRTSRSCSACVGAGYIRNDGQCGATLTAP